MTVQSLTEAHGVPCEYRQHVGPWTQDGWSHCSWQHVAEDELDWMSIFSGDSDGRRVSVMHLVNVGIECFRVQRAVAPVECEVFAEHEEEDAACESDSVWQVLDCS